MFARTVVMAAIGITCVSASAFAASNHRPRGVNAREHRQAVRIREGVKADEITRAELDRLRADEAAIRAEERVYRRTGDGLNRREVRDLEQDLNRTSRQIYRAKHNNQGE
jgi:hypothetical protein